MAQKLVKAWNQAKAGTLITTDPEEAKTQGATLVDSVRLAYLEAHGFFGAFDAALDASETGDIFDRDAKEIMGDLRAIDAMRPPGFATGNWDTPPDIIGDPVAMDESPRSETIKEGPIKGGINSPPITPRPDSKPGGQGGGRNGR